MTPRGRTNQLLYHAQLLLDTAWADDEHTDARRMAHEEGALATLELALNAALRELTEHAQLSHHDWRELLADQGPALAGVVQLRELARREDSWLARLLARLESLHDIEGASRRRTGGSSMIASVSGMALSEELDACIAAFKTQLDELRETSEEW
ncbi:DUF6586 family protein [Chromohalobacter sarecensis]|uniref:DUF6586 family protein n=1 Tax=Chromohalobacter sarecensis TaxID=245294 RepID=A0ABV9D419_9GAMM|nr:DUF6586 family protein [Chromohalobacter sarecensis]MCK0714313.1 hypothetical protein [Chromohalobacter sarecensis]